MKQAEKEIMVAGLEAKGFEMVGVFEEKKDDICQFYAEVWSDSKHMNVFTHSGDGISHYFFQVGDKKAIKRLLQHEDLLKNKSIESWKSIAPFKEAIGYKNDGLSSEEKKLWDSYEMEKLLHRAKSLSLKLRSYRSKVKKVEKMLDTLNQKEAAFLGHLHRDTGLQIFDNLETFLKMPKKDIVAVLKANQPKLEVE